MRLAVDHLHRGLVDAANVGTGPMRVDLNIASVNPDRFTKRLNEGCDPCLYLGIGFGEREQYRDAPLAVGLLRAQRERPSCNRAANKRDKFTSSHAFTPQADDHILPHGLKEGGGVLDNKFGYQCRIWVIRDQSTRSCLPLDVRFQLKAPSIVRTRNDAKGQNRHCRPTTSTTKGDHLAGRSPLAGRRQLALGR